MKFENRAPRLYPISIEETCDMGDEDGCPNPATYTLDAPATYVRPLYCCNEHAAEQITYHRARIVPRVGA